MTGMTSCTTCWVWKVLPSTRSLMQKVLLPLCSAFNSDFKGSVTTFVFYQMSWKKLFAGPSWRKRSNSKTSDPLITSGNIIMEVKELVSFRIASNSNLSGNELSHARPRLTKTDCSKTTALIVPLLEAGAWKMTRRICHKQWDLLQTGSWMGHQETSAESITMATRKIC